MVVRDVDTFGRRARLRWIERRLALPGAGVPVGSWTGQHPAIGVRMVLTGRAREQACRRVGRDGHSVAAVVCDLGVGWHTIMSAIVDRGKALVDDLTRTSGVRTLGVDVV